MRLLITLKFVTKKRITDLLYSSICPDWWTTKGMDAETHEIPNLVKLASCEQPIYTVSEKNNTDVAYYNFNVHQPIIVIFGRDLTEREC